MTTRDTNHPGEPAVRSQLERILSSPQFAAAESARKLLRFLVEETLEGRSHRLKEYTLATDVFELQDEIASRVVATIAQPRGVIARPELASAQRKPPERLDSYDCLLLFYDYGANRSPAGHRKIRAALETETREDPGVAALWAALSFVHTDTWRFGYNVADSRARARDRALDSARQAAGSAP